MNTCFPFSGIISRNAFAGSRSKCMLSFFSSDCTLLPAHQQYMRKSFSTFLPAFGTVTGFHFNCCNRCVKCYLIFLLAGTAEYLFRCLFAIMGEMFPCVLSIFYVECFWLKFVFSFFFFFKEKKHGYQRGKRGRDQLEEFGISRSTLLYINITDITRSCCIAQRTKFNIVS